MDSALGLVLRNKERNEKEINKKIKEEEEKRVIIFSGDRNCKESSQIIDVLKSLDKEKDIIVTGGCQGVDKIVENEAKRIGFKVLIEKAYWNNRKSQTYNTSKGYDPMAGPRRNQRMLNKYKVKKVYLFHNFIQNSKGTKDMMEKCLHQNIPFELKRTSK